MGGGGGETVHSVADGEADGLSGASDAPTLEVQVVG